MKAPSALIFLCSLSISWAAWSQGDLYDLPAETQAKSKEQTVTDLEDEFERSVRDYDGMILRERDQAVYEANQRGAQSQVEEYDRNQPLYDEPTDKDYSDTASGGGDGGETKLPTTELPNEGGIPKGQDSEVANEGGDGIIYEPPADIPSGDDDDLVARQLRELAMREPDPDVREQLWEEYRKYKNK